MAWTPHIYEDRPVLRERVLAAAAIGTVLLGGAMAMDTIVTGGWQWGVASASVADNTQYYQDDVDQQWSEPAPSVPVSQPVTLANASAADANAVSTMTPEQVAASANGLDGSSPTVSLTSYAPATQTAPDGRVDDVASQARFDKLEADMHQADPGQAVVASTDDGN